MNKYLATYHIHLSKGVKIEFENPIEIILSEGPISSIQISAKETILIIAYSLSANSEKEAEELTRFKVEFLANKLAFKEKFIIENIVLDNLEWINKTGTTHAFSRLSARIQVIGEVNFKFGKTHLKALKEFAEKQISTVGEDYLRMYRNAIAEKHVAMRYFLLYRILEKILGKQKENWIKTKEPSVQIIKDSRDKKTIYTFLRDHIHPKVFDFPYSEIERYVNGLNKLVIKAIEQTL